MFVINNLVDFIDEARLLKVEVVGPDWVGDAVVPKKARGVSFMNEIGTELGNFTKAVGQSFHVVTGKELLVQEPEPFSTAVFD